MRCPLLMTGNNANPELCLMGKCACWDEVETQCSIITIMRNLEYIGLKLANLVGKIPQAEVKE